MRTIRIDVDQDEAWLCHDIGALRSQLRVGRALANELGFGYRVFRSGKRGIQAVYSLPGDVPNLAGRWLSKAVSRALERRSPRGANDFKSAFDGILRLPLGMHMHPRSLGLGLWLDPETAFVLTAEEQGSVLLNAFGETPSHEAFLRQVDEIEERCSACADSVFDFDQIAVDLRHIPLVDCLWPTGAPQGRSSAVSAAATVEPACSASGTTAGQGREWAREYWERGFEQGGSHEFLIRGGVRAAFLLFGDEAHRKLMEAAQAVPAESGEAKRRINLIDHLVRTHKFLPGAGPMAVDALDERHRLALGSVKALMEARIYRRDARAATQCVAECAICLFAGSSSGIIELSSSFLEEWLSRNPHVGKLSAASCNRAIRAVTEGDPGCRFALLRKVLQGGLYAGMKRPSRFSAGSDLEAFLPTINGTHETS